MFRVKNIGPFILFIIILMLWQCKGEEEDDFRLITFQGSNVLRFLDNTSFSSLDSLGYVTLLTRNGDWLYTDNFSFFVRKDLPDSVNVNQLDSLLYINGDLAGISISKNSPSLSFFNQLTEEDISHLRTLQFETTIWDSIRPYLKNIALVNPAVDIVYSSEIDSIPLFDSDLLWLSQYFQPRALFLVNETDSISFSILKNFSSLETLLISHPIRGDSYLPHLPYLKEIIFFNDDDSTSISYNFFRKNPDIESLTIIFNESADIDWTSLNKLKNLRNLYINADSINLNDIYKNHPHLESLHLGLDKGVSISSIYNKNNLKWLSLNPVQDPFMGQNPKVLQDSFPELEYLEFNNNDSLLDYNNFKNLKKLKYLIVYDKVGLDTTLHNLDHLRYLSLPDDFLKDSLNLVKIQKALPKTIITPNSGACLGSGWLLFLIPLAGLWFYFLKPKKDKGQ